MTDTEKLNNLLKELQWLKIDVDQFEDAALDKSTDFDDGRAAAFECISRALKETLKRNS